MSRPNLFNLFAYFSGKQPLWRAYCVSMICGGLAWLHYLIQIHSSSALNSWVPLQYSMSINLIVSVFILWIIWRSRNNTYLIAANILARALVMLGSIAWLILFFGLLKWGFLNIYILLTGVLIILVLNILANVGWIKRSEIHHK